MSEENPSSYFDDWETFVINYDNKKWKPEFKPDEGEIVLHKKGSTKSW